MSIIPTDIEFHAFWETHHWFGVMLILLFVFFMMMLLAYLNDKYPDKNPDADDGAG